MAKRRRRRWRWRMAAGGLVVVILWALLGGPATPTETGPTAKGPSDEGSPETTRPGAADAPADAERSAARAPPDEPRGAASGDPVPAPAGTAAMPRESDPQAPVPGEPVGAREMSETDRLEGCLHRAGRAVAEGRLGGAFAAMDDALGLDLQTRALRERLDREQRELRAVLAARTSELIGLVASGHVAQARQRLARLRDPAHPAVEEALRGALASRGWPAWPLPAAEEPEPASAGAALPAAPDQLARGRQVRVPYRDGWPVGRVVGATSGPERPVEDVTVELRTPAGVAYAFVARTALEPVAPRVDEAADQGIAALRGGDAVLAAMWLSYCRGAGGADHERVRELARAAR